MGAYTKMIFEEYYPFKYNELVHKEAHMSNVRNAVLGMLLEDEARAQQRVEEQQKKVEAAKSELQVMIDRKNELAALIEELIEND